MAPKIKTFDCVEMKHRGAELVRKDIESASFEEELKYWQEGTEELRKRQELLKQKQDEKLSPKKTD